MKLFIGLGNPGSQYAGQRHNVGFMALESIASTHSFTPWRKRFQGLTAEGNIDGESCLLLKPATFMNESGRAAGEAMRFYKLALADIYVFHDELDLAPGKLRVKTGGGTAGHNGLRSLSAHIGNDYHRVRIGIGHPGRKELVSGYVLHDFAKADKTWLDPLIDAMARAASHLAAGDAPRFMTDVAEATQPVRERRAKPVADGAARNTKKDGDAGGGARGEAAAAGRPSQRDLAMKAARLSADRKPAGSGGGGRPGPKGDNALAAKLKKWLKGQSED